MKPVVTPGNAPAPVCPRCGYDLSGTCAAWSDSCPVNGICPECGLDFAWTEILHPMRAVPRWSYEHTAFSRLRALQTTLARTLRPWSFWSVFRLSWHVRVGRLSHIIVLVLLLTHLVIGGFTLVAARTIGIHNGAISDELTTSVPPWVHRVIHVLVPYQAIGWHDGMSPGDCPWVVLSILCFLLTPAAYLALPITMKTCRVRKAHLLRAGVYSLTPMPLVFLAMFLCSRASPFRISPTSWWISDQTFIAIVFDAMGALPLLVLGWLSLYWWYVTTRYLKLPHAAGVTGAMVLLGLLASLVLTAFLHPGFVHNHVLSAIFW